MEQSDLLISTDQNIQKEYINIPQVISSPGDYAYHDYLVPHNLGYIPSAKVWYEPLPGQWYPLALTQLQDGTSGDFLQFSGAYSLSTESLIISLVNFTGTTNNISIWARIYLDD